MNKNRFTLKQNLAYLFIMVVFNMGYSQKKNPPKINEPLAMPDINMVQHGDRVYAFSGTDVYPYDKEINTFIMPYWRCYSSSDLIHCDEKV